MLALEADEELARKIHCVRLRDSVKGKVVAARFQRAEARHVENVSPQSCHDAGHVAS
jgi:hypothetical protein